MGKYDLRKSYERGSITRDVESVIVHEDWKQSTLRHDADIAIIFFEKTVEFSNYIQPACLPSSDWKEKSLKGGKVFGWGSSERTKAGVPENITRKIELEPPITNEQCFFENEDLLRLSSSGFMY